MTSPSSIETQEGELITPEDLARVVGVRGRILLGLARLLTEGPDHEAQMSRPLLGDLLSQSSQLEELLDADGARRNRRWLRFRSPVAAIKGFSRIEYELLHMRRSLPHYNIASPEADFLAATQRTADLAREVIVRACHRVIEQADRLGVELPAKADAGDYVEMLPPGRLPDDRSSRKVESASKTVTRLATAFLNLTAQADLVHICDRTRPEDYPDLLPDPVSEESLRDVQQRFHNLQSLYDTFVSATETEGLDKDLPRLRGHITIVYHLVHVSMEMAHYYERHLVDNAEDVEDARSFVAPGALLEALVGYALAFASRYISSGQKLCQAMLQRYAEVTEIEVPIPRYRGFHVRPSTLLAKIVMHYGSEVRMEFDGETYDASSPLDIFRVNEKINARKRCWLAEQVGRLSLDNYACDDDEAVRDVLHQLAQNEKIVIYEQPLDLADLQANGARSLYEQVIECVARLQATGKIDMHLDLTVKLTGDKRVLDDIRVLAENGYGEDKFGNNIDLPQRLSYLRR